jgi:hypothetical protein
VDEYDPLLPVSMPRGYGGVAIIWRKDIDHTELQIIFKSKG